MRLFQTAFNRLLSERQDLQQRKNADPVSPWHRKVSRGTDAKKQNMEADRYKFRHTGGGKKQYSAELNQKIESIRNGQANFHVLSDIDMKYIYDNYSTNDVPKDKPKRIFPGVVVYWDHMKDTYVIKADG